jgi:hypothetical protein
MLLISAINDKIYSHYDRTLLEVEWIKDEILLAIITY